MPIRVRSSYVPETDEIKPVCVRCRSEMVLSSHRKHSASPVDRAIWTNGLVHTVSAGYGSDHDTNSFVIGICDSCISLLARENVLIDIQKFHRDNPAPSQEEYEDMEKKGLIGEDGCLNSDHQEDD